MRIKLDEIRSLYFLISALAIISMFLLVKFFKIKNKYSDIIDIDTEVEKSEKKNQQLKDEYSIKRKVYESLIDEINMLRDDLKIMDISLLDLI